MDSADDRASEGWTTATIEALAEPKGVAYGVLKPGPLSPSGVRMLRVTDVRNGEINESDIYRISAPLDAEYRRTKLRGGEVLVSIQGTVGRVAIVPTHLAGSNISRTLAMIRLRDPDLALWVQRALESPKLQQAMRNAVTGTTRDSLNLRDLRQIQVPIAPLSQRVHILDTLAEADRLRTAATTHLTVAHNSVQRFRQLVLTEACSGGLTEDWRAANQSLPAITAIDARRRRERVRLGAKYRAPVLRKVDSLPELPGGWAWIALPELGEMGRGKSKHRPRNDPKLYGGPYPFIQTGDIARSSGRILTHSQTYNELGLSQSRLWPANTVCITIAANIADGALLTYPACFPDSVVGVVCDETVALPEYLELFLRTVRHDLAAVAPATSQANINLAILDEVPVAVPPLAEQAEIVRRASQLFSHAEKVQALIDAALRCAAQVSVALPARMIELGGCANNNLDLDGAQSRSQDLQPLKPGADLA